MSLDNQKIPEISVVVLCYKGGESIRPFVNHLDKFMFNNFGHEYELILVGNYHPNIQDITPQIVNQIAQANSHIQAVSKPKQGMMGWDLRSGLEATKGKLIAIIDGDNQMPIEDLIRVYNLLKEKNLDLAKTYRVQRGDSLWRSFISFCYNLVFKILFPGLHSRDVNSKPKIMTRQNYQKLKLESDGWFIDAEIMIQARRYNFKIDELPTVFRELSEDRRSFIKIPAILEFIKNLVLYRLKEFKHQSIKK